MEWNFTGNEPVYLQIMEHFRSAVLSGNYPVGSRIPSVRDLAAQARVTPHTMQRALYALEQEQLLVANGPLGRYVTQDEAVLQALRQREITKTVHHCAELLDHLGLTLADAAAIWENEAHKEV